MYRSKPYRSGERRLARFSAACNMVQPLKRTTKRMISRSKKTGERVKTSGPYPRSKLAEVF